MLSSPSMTAAGRAVPRRRLWPLLAALMGGGGLGLLAGFALGIFIYPFWFLTDVASDVAPATARPLAEGAFIHANPSDPVHWGKGGVSLLETPDGQRLVRLDEQFEVGPGPRFHVYLVDRAPIASNADFRASAAIDLGRLRAFKGSQNYAIPAAVDLGPVRSVVIWCKEFGVLITPAALARTG
jgi:hypothetical protein